jgi:hypothetical protein
MNFFADIFSMLAFRERALRTQAERRTLTAGIVFFSLGCLLYAVLRNYVYATLPELARPGDGSFINISVILRDWVRSIVFLLVLYVPALILLGKTFSGDGRDLLVSKQEYQAHASTLLPLWGALFLITAPLQLLIPHFVSIGLLDISFGILIRSILLCVYTVWAIKQLSHLSWVQSLGVFALSWLTFAMLIDFTSIV